MKKVGLILLALVLALGVLGVGYAMWSDTLLISGTVNTGTVDINVVGLDNYSGTYVYKDLDNGEIVTVKTPPALDPKYNNTEDYELVAFSEARAGAGNDEIIFEYDNLFPESGPYCADFKATYDGSIPVHVAWDWRYVDDEGELYEPSLIPDPVIKYLLYYYTTIIITDSNGSNIVNPYDTALAGVQLHQGDWIKAEVCITIPQEWNYGGTLHNSQEDLGGLDFDFVAKLITYQWNEPAPTVYPTP